MEEKNPNIKYMLAALLLVLVDQITKLAVKGFALFGLEHHGMQLYESITVIDNFLWLTFVENPGMAFGIKFGEAKIFLSLFSIAASILLGWYLLKVRSDSPWVKLGLTLILAGATGNLIDRVFYGVFYGEAPLFYGKVVDFIEVEFWDFSILGKTFTTWPVFNVADSCVTCGMILLILNHKRLPFAGTPPAQQQAEGEHAPNETQAEGAGRREEQGPLAQ